MIADPETLLQNSIHRSESIISKYRLIISTSLNKTTSFTKRQPIRGKIIINN
jgi:hypothetical protein